MEMLRRIIRPLRPGTPAGEAVVRRAGSVDSRPPEAMRTTPQFAPSARPLFIIGAPRSGTSITTWALGQHPNIQPMPETAWIAVMALAAQQAYDIGSERGRLSHLSNVELPPEPFFRRMGEAVNHIVHDVFEERCARVYGNWREQGEIRVRGEAAEMLLRRRSGDPKERWIDGTPANSMFVWGLAMLFPEARFIHLLRRPHEVVTSLANFDAVGQKRHAIDDAITTWIDHTEGAYLAQKGLGARLVHVARFEDLSAAPDKYLAGILSFAGEPYSADCLRPLSRKINSSNVGKERDDMLRTLRGNALYRKAEELYTKSAAPFGDEPDPAALAELKERFAAQSRLRRLIG